MKIPLKKIKIFPYKLGSESARNLARALDTICVKPDGNYKPFPNHVILNWGNSKSPTSWTANLGQVLNLPNNVLNAINKLSTLRFFKESNVPTPEWTTDFKEAVKWVGEGHTVVARTKLNGTGGEGIVFLDGKTFTKAPLYTKLIPKAREYRVHVFNGEVIDIQQKKRREGNDSDGRIKNLANGWVFTRENMTPPPSSHSKVAIDAVMSLGLDFGAVDILTKDDKCYVLEVNTACGLEGSTITSYAEAIKKYLNNYATN